MSTRSWQDAIDRDATTEAGGTNVEILTALRPRWSERRTDDTVATALRRRTERGVVTVTGDVRPATAVAAVEALLYQL